MNEEILKQMREVEATLAEAVKSIKHVPNGPSTIRPVQLEMAKVLAELYRIEASIQEDTWIDISAAVQEPAIENKEAIAEQLLKAVQLTRAGQDVQAIEILDEGRTAGILYRNGHSYRVDIEADSGIAMIRDICRGI